MNITNVKFYNEITYGEEVEHFTDIKELYPIPSDSIIYKTVTGIGATYSEVVAPRHSIIVLPHISIISSKQEFHTKEGHNTFSIHGEIKKEKIFDYLKTCAGYAKFLTTPKGLDKIIRVLHESRIDGKPIDYKNMFFLLIDECHKLIQDSEYRLDLVDVMEHFFQFQNKSMVSATPLPPSDPRFKDHGFKHIKVGPNYDIKQNIELIHVNSLVNGLETYIKENNSDCYCIFFNSVVGISGLIKQLDLKNDYQIYCSKESSDILRHNGEVNTDFQLNVLKKFNFFTSSFFNGLDIIMDYKPDIIILTDCGYKNHTLIDPYTDALQIIGRFRKKSKEDVPYNKVTHINNSSNFTNPISEAEAYHNIELSKFAYNHIKTLKISLPGTEHYDLFDQALSTVKPFSRLITKKGELSHFRADNYIDDERVKNYYKNASALRTAYNNTNLYNVTNKRELYEKSELKKLQTKSIRYSKEMNQNMAETMFELEEYRGLEIYYQQISVVEKLSLFIFEAYNRLGFDMLKKLKFSARAIETALTKLDIEEKKNSFPVINIMHKSFQLNTSYTWESLKKKLQKIYKEHNIQSVASATHIERYFECVIKKEKGNRVYIFKSQLQYPVTQIKHI